MIYRNATIEDIPGIVELQKKYHIATINESDKADGFVTTLFTETHFEELIEKENGITIACNDDKVVAYVMAASWEYWIKWPLFQHMIHDLQNTEYMGQTLTVQNSYQYGPICIDKDYRGTEVLIKIFNFSISQMNKRYPIMITFINHINHRSYYAHTKKLGLDVIKSFEFNHNTYYELGYDTSKIKSIQGGFVLNPYIECPTVVTKTFTFRLIREDDSASIFKCYNDKTAVELMNDDNCDFGFYVDSQEKMSETIGYWLDFYKKKYFIRFSIVDNATGDAVGTVEGFSGETGVLRVDIASAYEKASYLSEIFIFAKDNFHAFFGNEFLVTKAIPKAVERRQALKDNEWEFTDTFRAYQDYYKIKMKI